MSRPRKAPRVVWILVSLLHLDDNLRKGRQLDVPCGRARCRVACRDLQDLVEQIAGRIGCRRAVIPREISADAVGRPSVAKRACIVPSRL
jgi:hypothetical protein